MTDHGTGDPGRAAQDRLTEEARATATALLDWLGTRIDPAATSGAGSRPAQSPGPCSWCPVCALVAALRGEQPELTAKLAEQASGLMVLLRLMVAAHQSPEHDQHHQYDQHGATAAPQPAAPEGWPAEWGAWDGWVAPPADPAATTPGPADSVLGSGTGEAGEPDAADLPPSPAGRRRGAPIRRSAPRSAAFRPPTPTPEPAVATGATPPAGDPPPPPTAPRAEPAPTTRPATATESTRPPPPGPGRRVQRIPIRRAGDADPC